MLISSPFFQQSTIPAQIKVILALSLSLVLYAIHGVPVGSAQGVGLIAKSLPEFLLLMGQELGLGLLIGFTANLIFYGVRMTGEYLSVQMGLAIASAFDPASGTQGAIVGQVYYYFAMLIFLSLDLHHWLILAVHHSYTLIPVGEWYQLLTAGALTERLLTLSAGMFVLSLSLALPVMGMLLLTETALAFVAKLMPQMNIFIVGLPLKLVLGLGAIAITLPYAYEFLTLQFDGLGRQLMTLFAT
jgi:flagellar biosynthetic protein FliR